jgi:hypothetical protein
MVAVPDDDGCKVHYQNLTRIVRSFAGNDRRYESAWLLIVICPS